MIRAVSVKNVTSVGHHAVVLGTVATVTKRPLERALCDIILLPGRQVPPLAFGVRVRQPQPDVAQSAGVGRFQNRLYLTEIKYTVSIFFNVYALNSTVQKI